MGNHGGSSPPDRTKGTCIKQVLFYLIRDLNGLVATTEKLCLSSKLSPNAAEHLQPRRKIKESP